MSNASFEETRKIKHQGHGVCLLVVNVTEQPMTSRNHRVIM